MIKKIIEFYLKPYNLPKTKVLLFGLLVTVFLTNILYVRFSGNQNFVEILSENSTPAFIMIGLILIFFYMIYVDFNYAKRNQEKNKLIISVVENSNISDSLKEKLIDKIN